MRIAILIGLCYCAAIGCQTKTNTEASAESKQDSMPPSSTQVPRPGSACYLGVIGQDSFRLKVDIVAESATGTLAYRFKEKDSSFGNIDGQMFGDTLIADFTFRSEGVSSVREVAFVLSPETAMEGYGPVSEQHGIMVFDNPHGLQYGNGIKMQKVPCDDFPFDGLRLNDK